MLHGRHAASAVSPALPLRYPSLLMPRSRPPFEITREAILGDGIRARMRAMDPELTLLTPEEHRASIASLMQQRPDSGDIWLFAYGSLIWNPLIHFVEKRIATARGYHRRFCLWSRTGRGTTAKPGLTLGLERGGCCRGVAYRIGQAQAAHELEVVWGLEMLTGAYAPRWLKLETEAGGLHAIAFLINRGHTRYAGRLPEDRVTAVIAEAHGPLGPCATYLFNTVAHLEALGIRDSRLQRLRDRVAARIEQAEGT
ncbi:MAG TPA: gamma-glutamylcyclotransferase [Stellaceae bacterium]|nr:gamma-glutamylcyclotransferase [Stellaceae bacterium]